MEPRRFPPDPVELEAIQQNSTQVFHKVHFPNETNQVWLKKKAHFFQCKCKDYERPGLAWDHELVCAAASAGI